MTTLLTERQEDALREVANMGSAKAASMLARLVGDVGVLVDVPVVLSANRYQLGWLLVGGDDPAASTDSRAFGAVDPAVVEGRPWFRYWPPRRLGRVR